LALITLTLILDNYDSFTFNLVQQVAAITGVEPIVVRNDELSWEELLALRFDRVIISPGPGTPENPRDFGICRRVIEELDCPILGVCLGHQGICHAFGARIVPAAEVMHGRTSLIFHSHDQLFRDVPSPFEATRYHSLVAVDLPDCLERIAWTASDEIMAVRHKSRPVWGVQFHPESICTPDGDTILRNFLRPDLALPDAARLFRGTFAGEPHAFWLDGSAGGRFSYIGCGSRVIEGIVAGQAALDRVARELAAHRVEPDPALPFPFQGGWVGYVGYDSSASFVYADRFIAIDHQTGRIWPCNCEPKLAPRLSAIAQPPSGPFTFAIAKPDYFARIEECLAAIRAGESYELCLTNQLRGQSAADPLTYFETLRRLNPAPYAAYLRYPEFAVACSSPELFLAITAAGHVTSKPIKGTIRRSEDPAELAADEKNRAENLMIVDLVRNDLGRVSKTGSVKVTGLREIETFATVHHMVSTIESDLKPGMAAIDCIRAAFPPGSMTGAPKLRTMEILGRLETRERGIYSGCIGFLSLTGAATFNVAIRTAVFRDGEVTIGTGGAIVAQSDPVREWEELVLKAEVLLRAFDS
jgi:para-aminobenzoate synthetase